MARTSTSKIRAPITLEVPYAPREISDLGLRNIGGWDCADLLTGAF
jgi:hypothetical protein